MRVRENVRLVCQFVIISKESASASGRKSTHSRRDRTGLLSTTTGKKFREDRKDPPGPRLLPLPGNLLQLDLNNLSNTLLTSSTSVPLLAVLLILLLVYLVSESSFNMNDPPGPRPLPLLGNLLQLDLKNLGQTLQMFSKKYGSVFTVYLGPQKVVILAGYDTIKEALVNYSEEFGDRDVVRILYEVSQGHGVAWSNGDCWKELRRFTLTNLKDYGMGKRASEDKITDECQYLIEELKKLKGEASDLSSLVQNAVSNIVCSMVYGSRFEYDDPEFTSLVQRTSRNNQLLGSPSIQLYNMFPWIGKFISNKREYFKLAEANKRQNLKFFDGLKETLDPQMCRGFVDAFLVHKQHLEKSKDTNSHFHDQNLLMTVIQLFAAGTDTTATTLRWALLFMAKYPKIQDRVQEELSRVVGGRQVKAEDRINLDFVNAVIHETQRLADIAPMSLPHKTSQDVLFHGYVIKKGTTVYPLLTSVHFDEKEWARPRSFHPAHFLDKDGKFVKRDAFIPFSAGRRACLGESLARMELFLFFSTLLQHFRFTPAPGVTEDELDLTSCVGLSLHPASHKLCAVPCM